MGGRPMILSMNEYRSLIAAGGNGSMGQGGLEKRWRACTGIGGGG